MHLLDTDMMTVLERGGPEGGRLKARLDALAPDDLATTIVSYEEQTRGWLAVSAKARTPNAQIAAYRRLKTHLLIYSRIAVLDYDERAAAEFERVLPFAPRRCFTVFDVPSRDVRGEHAHRECWQFLVCAHGSVMVHVDDGTRSATVALDSPHRGVLVPPMVWASQYRYSPDAVLVVFASHPYDDADYIRSYTDYLAELR